MSKREREAEARVAKPKLGGSRSKHPARARYWEWHDRPEFKHSSGTGLEKKLRRDNASLLSVIHALGATSDVAVLREKPENLVRNLAFVQHQQKLHGAIVRFAKGGWPGKLPRRVEALVQRTAFITTEGR